MKIKRLTPDLTGDLQAAGRHAEQAARYAELMRAEIQGCQDRLQIIQRAGAKAAKLDCCVQRIEEILRSLNGLEIGSLHAITVRQVVEELWQKLP